MIILKAIIIEENYFPKNSKRYRKVPNLLQMQRRNQLNHVFGNILISYDCLFIL